MRISISLSFKKRPPAEGGAVGGVAGGGRLEALHRGPQARALLGPLLCGGDRALRVEGKLPGGDKAGGSDGSPLFLTRILYYTILYYTILYYTTCTRS